MKRIKAITIAFVGLVTLSSLPAMGAEGVCKEGIWEIPYRQTLCYRHSKEQYMCVKDGPDMKFRLVQKITLESSIKEICTVVSELGDRPDSAKIVK